jgi:ferrous iron transport protein B
MARVAFIKDRIFRKYGLSGKSFIPMQMLRLRWPGIMATKRLKTKKRPPDDVMTTTFIPAAQSFRHCADWRSAMFPGGWWMAPVMYFGGNYAVLSLRVILKKTRMLRETPPPLSWNSPSTISRA